MNGISNFNIGDFRLVDSRAFIQANDVVADGQILNRADYPELWAYAQMLTPIADTDWVSTPENRGKYSLGDGSTTFRVPDRNGVQKQGVGGFTGPNSITALYARGDAGDSAINGTVSPSGVPNITGSITINTDGNTLGLIGGGTGAFSVGEQSAKAVASNSTTTGAANRARVVGFNARLLSDIYGRTTTEVRTNTFFGVWVIRAKGAFIAANTSWSVINSDETLPVGGTPISGGHVISEYKADGEVEGSATLRLAGTIGTVYSARLQVYNKTSGVSGNFDFTEDGNINSPKGRVLVKDDYGLGVQGSTVLPTSNTNQFYSDSNGSSPWAPNNGGGFQTSYDVNRICQFWISQGGARAYFRANSLNNNPRELKSNIPWVTIANDGTSDARFKDIGDDLDLSVALNNIKALEFKNFTYKSDESKTPRRGVIAQQAETVDPEYVHSAEDSGIMTLDSNPLLLDALAAIKCLSKKVEDLEAQLAAE